MLNSGYAADEVDSSVLVLDARRTTARRPLADDIPPGGATVCLFRAVAPRMPAADSAQRLRERLRSFCPPDGDPLHGLSGAHAAPRLPRSNLRRLAVAPLRSMGADRSATECAQALQAELEHRLHGVFGAQLVPYGPGAAGATHVLEATLRVDGDQLRATVRLVDRLALCIVFSEQYETGRPFGFAQQDFLALSICRAIQNHFSAR